MITPWPLHDVHPPCNSLPDPSQVDPITGQPLPQEGGEMGEVPQDPDLEAQGEVTDAQAQKDARKAEI